LFLKIHLAGGIVPSAFLLVQQKGRVMNRLDREEFIEHIFLNEEVTLPIIDSDPMGPTIDRSCYLKHNRSNVIKQGKELIAKMEQSLYDDLIERFEAALKYKIKINQKILKGMRKACAE